MGSIRRCRDDDIEAIFAIVNAAAEAYRGVIPADRWHEPYMPMHELEREIAAGVRFWGYEEAGALVGIMGIQPVEAVDLIRHAYVLPASQGRGVGARLLAHLMSSAQRRVLVGTWAAADWAIRFYRRHGFELVSPAQKDALLQTYWSIPARQVETSVVLARPAYPPGEPRATSRRISSTPTTGPPTPSSQKANWVSISPTIQSKFIPKKPVMNVSGRKIVATTVSQ
jgi:GNAT superfamily N-acetyltransferase